MHVCNHVRALRGQQEGIWALAAVRASARRPSPSSCRARSCSTTRSPRRRCRGRAGTPTARWQRQPPSPRRACCAGTPCCGCRGGGEAWTQCSAGMGMGMCAARRGCKHCRARVPGARRSSTAGPYQKVTGRRLPWPQLGCVHVTWSSSVFWRHLRPGRQAGGPASVHAAHGARGRCRPCCCRGCAALTLHAGARSMQQPRVYAPVARDAMLGVVHAPALDAHALAAVYGRVLARVQHLHHRGHHGVAACSTGAGGMGGGR